MEGNDVMTKQSTKQDLSNQIQTLNQRLQDSKDELLAANGHIFQLSQEKIPELELEIKNLQDLNSELNNDKKELNQTFDLIFKAIQRGTTRWREKDPDNRGFILPDTAELLFFLLDEAKDAKILKTQQINTLTFL